MCIGICLLLPGLFTVAIDRIPTSRAPDYSQPVGFNPKQLKRAGMFLRIRLVTFHAGHINRAHPRFEIVRTDDCRSNAIPTFLALTTLRLGIKPT
jgi:hypothetical protein